MLAATADPLQETRSQHSLFGEILDWMLMPLLLLWPISIAITYFASTSIANEPFDRSLEDRVTVLAQQVKENKGIVSAQLPLSARDILRADDVDNVYFQISDPKQELIAGDLDVPYPVEEEKPIPWAVLLRDAQIRNTEVRIAYVYVNLQTINSTNIDAGEPRFALVQVAETLEKRRQLAKQIVKGVIFPEFIILPIALTLVWFALTRGLSPLATLQEHIRARRPDDLSPIDASAVPEEISPLVRSLNDMLARLSQSIQLQKRFIADAAHQMKTPLAGMRMQSELAMRQLDSNEIRHSLQQLSKSSESATRMINQLLALARAETQTAQAMPFEKIELTELGRQVAQEWVQAALARRIDLGFEAENFELPISGNATMLREMLNNLIDNALRYTPSLGSVTIRIRANNEQQQAMVEVEDTGSGIPPSERAHVFERFYRILGSNVEGSGLGLAIVREIVIRHGADIELLSNPHSKDPSHPGSLFRICFRLEKTI
jgi:two-component system sensor histidine kinase TctE